MIDWFTGNDYPIDGHEYLCVDNYGLYRLGTYSVGRKVWWSDNGDEFNCTVWCVLPKPPVITKDKA